MPPILLRYLPHLLGLIGLIAGLWWFGHSRYEAGQEVVRAEWNAAIIAAQIEADKKEAEYAAAAKAMQDELVRVGGSLDAATARGRTLSARLSEALRRPCLPQAPGAAPGAGGAPGESGDGGEIERALGGHLEACARDAERLGSWQSWWKQVSPD
jgi:hypothetical protein